MFEFLAEIIETSEEQWRGHLMLIAGIGLLFWVLLRRNLNQRTRASAANRELAQQISRGYGTSVQGAPLVDAPREVLHMQASMFDLQRELKAELESRIAVVQSLLRAADRKIERLESVQKMAAVPSIQDQASEVRRLAQDGQSSEEIARLTRLSLGDVEFLRSLG